MEKKIKTIKKYFKDLKFFEEEHYYTVDDKRLTHSVSKIIDMFIQPFDSYNISKSVAKRRGIEQLQVLIEWKDVNLLSIKEGKEAHLFAEQYCLNNKLKPKTGLDKAIIKFWKEIPNHIKLVLPEQIMYHKKYLFAGTTDILLYDTCKEKYIVADYKTNKDIFKNYKNKKMLGEFSKLLDNPLNHYQIQLSLYQILFEQVFEESVYKRLIVWLKRNGTYELYETYDFKEKLLLYLEKNKNLLL
jgi:hypothetical protein